MEDQSFAPLSFKLSPQEQQSQAPKAQPIQHQHYTATLHSIKKQPVKPWRRPEQLPPRVYSVEPRGFRKLVQSLTGMPPRQARPRLLRDTVRMPPPPLELAPRSLPQLPMQSVIDHNASSIQTQLELSAPFPVMANLQSPNGFMGFISQPFNSGWCLSPLLSPGTLAAMDQGTSQVL